MGRGEELNIGMEVEFTGMHRCDVAKVVLNTVGCEGSSIVQELNAKGAVEYNINTGLGGWCVNRDSSIELPERLVGLEDADFYKCELITPVLKVSDCCVLYKILGILKQSGGEVNDSCGVHIHIDFQDKSLWVYKLIRKLYNLERTNILDTYCVPLRRRKKYCKPIPLRVYEEIIDVFESDGYSKDVMLSIIYKHLGEGVDPSFTKNPARYYWVNFDSVFKRNTVEFRLFNSTLEKSIIKSYITFILEILNL